MDYDPAPVIRADYAGDFNARFSPRAERDSHLVLETTGHVCRDGIRWGTRKWGDKDQTAVRMVLYKARAQPNSESQSPLGDVGSPEGRRHSSRADCYV